MADDSKTPAVAAPPDWRGLCEELFEALDGWHKAVFETGTSWVRPDETYLLDRARAALAQPEPEVVGPSDEELLELWQGWNLGWDPQKGTVLMPHPAEYARAVLARWGNYPVKPDSSAPALVGEHQAAPVPVASDVYFEFVVSDADYCTQAGGIAPSYAQALSEGQRYLAQYQQDGPHTLELRRVEVLPLPGGEVEA